MVDEVQRDETTERAPAEGAPPEHGETREAAGDVWIDASPERVWRALTDARELERWFPLEAEVEPGEGGRLRMSWGGEYDAEMPILVWDPPTHLRTSWFGQGVVTDYVIRAEKGGTRIRAVSSGFPLDPSWDEWVEGTVRGWAYELRALKHYLERHDGRDRRALFVRRRVHMPRERVWERLTGTDGLDPRWTEGERVDHQPPVQVATILEEPAGAMARASVEPVLHDDASAADENRGRAHDATLWISLWGASGDAARAIEREWVETLERAFPDGETMVERR
ncbi:MAG: SRPBCC domain-containing protein [Gemmatimonadota bacterium]|jgi:uncharacterized protein YndB with AHSA1/START domain